jgi:Leucine-rich repeat (LRR) protein
MVTSALSFSTPYVTAASVITQTRISDCAQKRLTELDLSGLNLTSVPASIKELSHIETLNLSNNFLEELPLEISHLKQLRICNLSRNKLGLIPECLLSLNDLTELNLSDNQISEAPYTALKAMGKARLDFSGNPFTAKAASDVIFSCERLRREHKPVPVVQINIITPKTK